jgi:ribose-phosphate pyrophosphokinase
MQKLDAKNMKVFAGRANPLLAENICKYLGIPLGRGGTELFPDGELIVRVDEDVRGRDCYVIQPTCHPVNAHWMELFIWIDTLRRASAKRVTAVIPYFSYARQDQKHAGRTPITSKLVANFLERAGADRVVAVDLHAPQVQGFFDIPVDHLHAGPVLGKWFASLNLQPTVFVSPDVGNVKRAQVYAEMLNGELCFIDKRRRSGMITEAKHVIGDVAGKSVLVVDDMITTAGTVAGACKVLREHGVKDIYIGATHAVLAPPAMERLAACPFTKLAVTDTIPLGNRADAIKDRLVVLSVAELLGEAIYRIHHNESVSALFTNNSHKNGLNIIADASEGQALSGTSAGGTNGNSISTGNGEEPRGAGQPSEQTAARRGTSAGSHLRAQGSGHPRHASPQGSDQSSGARGAPVRSISGRKKRKGAG